MSVLSLAILIFIILESLNIVTLYFNPDATRGNGPGVFKAWEKSKADPEMHQFVRYLVFWVAGVKLIFIALLLVILFTASEQTKLISLIALIISVASYYWRLHPIIRALDERGQIKPEGYSRTLGIMIIAFMALFVFALIGSFLS